MAEDTAVNPTASVIVAYLVHDPIGNVEGYINDFSPDVLQQAQDDGMVIIAEYSDGKRVIVDAADVKEPQPYINGIKIVAPSYVDKRTAATVECFAALAEIVNPSVATLAEDGTASEQKDPIERFMTALANLKALDSDGGDA